MPASSRRRRRAPSEARTRALRPPGRGGSVVLERLADAAGARAPQRATHGSACFDLYAAEDAELLPGQVTLVRTGLRMRAPPGTFLEIRPRSGLSTRGIIMVNAPGTIDRDYPGEVKVPLAVLFGGPRTLRAGDRVAQLRVVPDHPSSFRWGKVGRSTDRAGGFGSTGR